MEKSMKIDYYLGILEDRFEIEKTNNIVLMVFPLVILAIGVSVTLVLYSWSVTRALPEIVKIGPGIVALIIPNLQLKPILDTRARLSSIKKLIYMLRKYKSSAYSSNMVLPEDFRQFLVHCIGEIMKR